MVARSSLLRRIAALAALAPRLVRLAHHHYPDGLLGVRRRTMGKLEGKTALVTGGGRGIGRGIVVELAREGAVANSGVAARVATVAKTDPAEWRRVLATDLDGAFWTARAAIPHVVARKGVFLFISSIGADAAQAGGAPYHVAKAGVNALAKVLAKEVASVGVRVNVIAPGLVR